MLRNAVDGWNWISYAAGVGSTIAAGAGYAKFCDWQYNRDLRKEEERIERDNAQQYRKREIERQREAESYARPVSDYSIRTEPTRLTRPAVTPPREPYRTPVTPTSSRPAVTQPREPYRTPITPAREATRPQLPATPRKPETPALPVDPIEAARKRQRELGNGDKPKQLGSGN